ncbi:hypothetical protein HanLR1_Chr05g0178651 [Helianthus annuus]|nr:hypothetical protein HanHA89_Chr05g0189141 [Helianthus annuus]KAJ0750155.1 hypothetical protein HanLR1_Chr05g0178651 [Helianthus annuus]
MIYSHSNENTGHNFNTGQNMRRRSLAGQVNRLWKKNKQFLCIEVGKE